MHFSSQIPLTSPLQIINNVSVSILAMKLWNSCTSVVPNTHAQEQQPEKDGKQEGKIMRRNGAYKNVVTSVAK